MQCKSSPQYFFSNARSLVLNSDFELIQSCLLKKISNWITVTLTLIHKLIMIRMLITHCLNWLISNEKIRVFEKIKETVILSILTSMFLNLFKKKHLFPVVVPNKRRLCLLYAFVVSTTSILSIWVYKELKCDRFSICVI